MECECLETKLTQRIIKGGTVQYVLQCQNCFNAVGGAVKKSSVDFVPPPFDLEKKRIYDENRQKAQQEKTDRFLSERENRTSDWWRRYDEYRATGKWQAKKIRVFLRDNYLCQGCLEARAEVVHHLTYDRVGNELLIDLVSLCHSCHARAHKKDDAA